MTTRVENAAMTTERLAQIRQRIDELDCAIVRLLNQRAEKAALIGSLKRNLQIPLRSQAREEMVLKNITAANPGPLTDAQLLSIYRRVLRSMRALQEQAKLAAPDRMSPGE